MQVTDGSDTYAVRGGHPLLTRLSASGCTVTALIAAFLAVPQSREPEGKMLAATFALAVFGYASLIAGVPQSVPMAFDGNIASS